MYKLRTHCAWLLAGLVLGITPSVAQAGLVYVTEDDGVHAPEFFLNIDDTADDFVDLNFGTSSGAQLRYDVVDNDFVLNRNLSLGGSQLTEVLIERLASAPTCDGANEGRIYYNTTNNQTFVCDGTDFNPLENTEIDTADLADDAVTSAKILDGTVTTDDLADGSITGADLNLTDITVSDFTNDANYTSTGDNVSVFTNDAGYLTTVDISDNTNLAAGTGATLTGDTISVDLGTDIATAEIQDNAVTTDKIGTAGVADANRVLTTDGSGDPQWEDRSNFATSSLTTNNIFVGVGGVATDTAVSGDLSMIGGNFQIAANAVGSAEIATGAVETTEILDGTVAEADLNLTDITVSDFTNDANYTSTGDNVSVFTNDAGYLTTVDISDDTNLAAGTGATLTDDTISVDLGTTIETGEITDGTITFADLNNTDITVSDFTNDANYTSTGDNVSVFTNDAGYLTTVDISDDTNLAAGTGLTLTGDSLSADLGTDIATAEIQDNAVDGTKLGIGTTAGDTLFYDGTDWLRLGIGTAGQILQVNAGATAPEWAASASSSFEGATDTDITGAADASLAIFNNATSNWEDAVLSGDATMTNAGVLSFAADSVADNEIDYTAVTVSDFTNDANYTSTGDNVSVFTNDAGYLTTVDISDDTNLAAGTGLTLTGDSLSADLGTSIDSSEIDLNTIVADDIATGAVETTEILDGTIAEADLNLTDITLADFTNDTNFVANGDNVSVLTNDAGYLTTVDISDDTNLAAGTGLTLTGDSLSADLGTSIDSSEIDLNTIVADDIATGAVETTEILDGTIAEADLNLTDITLADFTNDTNFVANGDNVSVFTNDAGYLTTVDISDDTNLAAGTGATLTDDTISVDLGTTIETGEITDGTITFADLNNTDITVSDFTNDANYTSTGDNVSVFTNDAGYLTTVDISDDTNLAAGTGLTLTGDSLSADLGTDIATAEIQDNAVTTDKIGTAGVTDGNKVLTTNATGDPQWEDRSNFASNSLTTNNIFVGVAGVAVDTAVTGDLTMTAGNFQIAANAVGSAEIADDAVSDAEIDFANVTLADFTNDAGFVTTDNDTTYTASDGITLTGTNFTNDFSTAIETGEITDGTITFADLNNTDITVSDFTNDANYTSTGDNVSVFTNDAGYLTTVDISDDTNLAAGTGLTLTGDSLSADLGTSIDSSEIDLNTIVADDIATGAVETTEILDGTVAEADLNLTDITLADFTNDAGFVTTDNDTTYTASDGITLTGTNFTNDFSTAIETGEITDGTITFADLNNTDITVSDFTNDANYTSTGDNVSVFTNDAGYLTTVDISDDTNLAAGTGATLTGDTISVDLGTSIDASEIDTDAVGEDEIDFAAVTLADFTNDLSLTSAQIFVGSAGGVATGVAASGDVNVDNTGAFTIQGDSVALGTDTTGNYVQSLADAGSGDLTITNGATEGGAATIDITDDSLDFTELADAMTVDATTSFDLDTNGADLNFDANTLVIDSSANSVLIGATAETIDNAAFVPDAGDLFVADTLGVEGAIYTDATATKYQTIDIFGCVRGSASSGTVASGNSPVVRFDGNNNSQMRCSFAVPDDWVAGTDINIETYYSPSDNTTGDVRFNLRHAAKAVGEVIAGGDFVDTVAAAVTINSNTQLEIYEMVEDIPAAGIAADDMININLRRAPGDASDTYGGDINIHMLRIAYTGKRLE